jgi:hypothetical protein
MKNLAEAWSEGLIRPQAAKHTMNERCPAQRGVDSPALSECQVYR